MSEMRELSGATNYAGADGPQVAYADQPEYSHASGHGSAPEVYYPPVQQQQQYGGVQMPYQYPQMQQVQPQHQMYQTAPPPAVYQAQDPTPAKAPEASIQPIAAGNTSSTRRPLWRRYLVRFVLNAVIFGLTIHGVYQINNDLLVYDGYYFTASQINPFTSLKFCLATSCITWVALLYNIIREKGVLSLTTALDVIAVDVVIWILWLVAGAMHAAFVSSEYVGCTSGDCGSVITTSYEYQVTDVVFAFANLVAWSVAIVFAGLEWSRKRDTRASTVSVV